MKIKHSKFALFLTLCITLFSFSVLGQKSIKLSDLKTTAVKKDKLQTHKHKSEVLQREMSYRVLFPDKYNVDKNERYAVLYLLHGLTGDFTNWSDRTKLDKYLGGQNLIVVMPDGNNGWYTNSAVVEIDKYESYIIDELIPKVDKDLRTKANRESRIIAGLSMGGYGALKFGLKYPDKFILVGSFSGALRAAEWVGKDFGGWKVLAESITATFGDINSKTRKENDIFKILESKSRDDLTKLPFFYIDCGTEDILIKQNQDFAKLLQDQKTPHEFRQLPGKHDWKFWDSQIQEFLEVSEKYLK